MTAKPRNWKKNKYKMENPRTATIKTDKWPEDMRTATIETHQWKTLELQQ